ncbi:hypothetical protein ILYODFUR_001204 [Ilyodon furcidens]|uniref:Uncharacterized protein n=1 Tax=Ilyodon furcidens TaxID=33524 RepID=A0ABV0URZ9_9TELE
MLGHPAFQENTKLSLLKEKKLKGKTFSFHLWLEFLTKTENDTFQAKHCVVYFKPNNILRQNYFNPRIKHPNTHCLAVWYIQSSAARNVQISTLEKPNSSYTEEQTHQFKTRWII